MRVNEEIQSSEVRVITEDGKSLGVLNVEQALLVAKKYEQDLVEVSPNEVPPVCKLMDYGKFLYQQKKKDKKKSQSDVVQTKELRIRPNTGLHDLEIKINHAREFLEKNKKVRFVLQFQGREVAHPELGSKMLSSVIEKLSDVSMVEKPIDSDWRYAPGAENMSILLSPK